MNFCRAVCFFFQTLHISGLENHELCWKIEKTGNFRQYLKERFGVSASHLIQFSWRIIRFSCPVIVEVKYQKCGIRASQESIALNIDEFVVRIYQTT